MSSTYEMEMKVRVAFANWSADPDRLSTIKSLRFAIEQYQESVIEELMSEEPHTLTVYPREAAEKLKCGSCGGRGTISESVLHPTNPNLDSWESRPCHCQNKFINEPSEKNQLYLSEAQDLAEDKKCKTCSGSRTISIPVTHPTNPNLDSWTTHPCHCTRIY